MYQLPTVAMLFVMKERIIASVTPGVVK